MTRAASVHIRWAYLRLLRAGIAADALEPLLPLFEQALCAEGRLERARAALLALEEQGRGEGRWARAERLDRIAMAHAGIAAREQELLQIRATSERAIDAAKRAEHIPWGPLQDMAAPGTPRPAAPWHPWASPIVAPSPARATMAAESDPSSTPV